MKTTLDLAPDSLTTGSDKDKAHPVICHWWHCGGRGWGVEIHLYPCQTSGGWSTLRLGSLATGKYPLPIVHEVRLATGPVWTGVENPASTGVQPRTIQHVASRYADTLCVISVLSWSIISKGSCPILQSLLQLPVTPLLCTGLSFER
jgi:hypothetical protein